MTNEQARKWMEGLEAEKRLLLDLAAHALTLEEGLIHMKWCRHCGEDDWSGCDGGRQAEAALTAFQKTLEEL